MISQRVGRGLLANVPPRTSFLRSPTTISALRPQPTRSYTAPPQARGRLANITSLALAFSTGVFVAVYVQNVNKAPDSFTEFTDEAELAHATVLKAEAEGLAEVERLRKTDGWKEVDPYGYLSAGKLHRNFTAGTLKGKGKFALRPLLFHNADQTECVAILHIGERLSGHDLICHGGVLATLLDEMCARASIPSLPHKTGFTANLTLNYRSPVKVNQFIVIRSKLTKLEGRKAFAKARIESVDVDEEGKPKTVFVEATSLFVSPKNQLLALASRWNPS